jgi:hypothetical protein
MNIETQAEKRQGLDITFDDCMIELFCSPLCTHDYNAIHDREKWSAIENPFNGPVVPLMLVAGFSEIAGYFQNENKKISSLNLRMDKELYFNERVLIKPEVNGAKTRLQFQREKQEIGNGCVTLADTLQNETVKTDFEKVHEIELNYEKFENYRRVFSDFILPDRLPYMFPVAATVSKTLLDIGKQKGMPLMMYGLINVNFYEAMDELDLDDRISMHLKDRGSLKYDVAAARENRMIFKLRTRLFPLQ